MYDLCPRWAYSQGCHGSTVLQASTLYEQFNFEKATKLSHGQ